MPALKPTFSLTLGGLRATSDSPVGGPTRFVVQRDMDIPADGLQITLMERGSAQPGDTVTLALGHDGDEKTVFTGAVVSLRPGIDSTEVGAVGKMNALLTLRTATAYENRSAGTIASDLIRQAGLTAGTVDTGPTLPRFIMDKRRSAFTHLKALADRLGFELYTDRDGRVMFRALGAAASLDGGLGGVTGAVPGLGGDGYLLGQHLITAQAGKGAAAWAAVEVGGESPMSGQGDRTEHWLTTDDSGYRGTAGSGSPALLVLDALARTKDLADRFAKGRLATAVRTTHQVVFRVMGRPQLDLGDSVRTGDVADALINGSGYVRAVRHQFSARTGYVTDFRIAVES
jgi:phage protein D